MLHLMTTQDLEVSYGTVYSVAVAPAVAPIVPDGVTAASLTEASPVVLDGTMAARLAASSVSPSPVPASLLPHCLPSHYQLCKQYAGIWSCLNLCEVSRILGSRKYVLIPPLFEAAKFLGLHE